MERRSSAGGGRPLPVKLLSVQLREGTRRGPEDRTEVSIRGRDGGSSLWVSMVWMQGTVLEADPHRDQVLLLDETGTFLVQGVNSIPKGKPCLSQGKYVMVMGVILAISPEPVIRAVKMADLTKDAAVHRKMWKLEVEDLQQLLMSRSSVPWAKEQFPMYWHFLPAVTCMQI
ncbi:RecQ-mediated genome instability protein 2 [Merluccius polli]|uniref:RecQ-mediated genome instability protein 2 n=1 Tax=Merluccius polli TaxID=89951 RepID=A0AA47NB35_MERPO|nr:RecQ-mediated genome instability protein 2 [Merluccius polli]